MKKYQKVSCKKKAKEPKRCPKLVIKPHIYHIDICSGNTETSTIRRLFLIKTGILLSKDLRVQRSQPNPITKNYIKMTNRKSRHQKLTNKYKTSYE